MATNQVWSAGGQLISVNGKKQEEEESINNKLAQAAYQAIIPTATGAMQGTVYNPDGSVNHVIDNSRGLARREAEKENAFTNAYNTSVNANSAAMSAAIAAFEGQKPVIQNQYDDLAKQAYAGYMRGQSFMPYQSQNIATGAQDNLALQSSIAFQNTRADIGQNKAQALLALESQIAQAEASGAANLADLQQQYAALQAQYLQDAQKAAYEQAFEQQKLANAQDLAMAKAGVSAAAKPKATPTALPAAPTRMDTETALKLYSRGEIGKEQLSGILEGYVAAFGLPQREVPAPASAGSLPLANTGKFGWVVIPGLGRVALAELPRLVQSGEVKQVIQGDTVRYVKAG